MNDSNAYPETLDPSMSRTGSTPIVLSTLNARYIHTSFGLRYLRANLAELESQSAIEEFTLESRPEDIVESLLRYQPKIIGFGVYIWNVVETERVVTLLRAVAPEVVIVLGGPEVSYEIDEQSIVRYADHVISGWGEVSFRRLMRQLLAPPDSRHDAPALEKVIAGEQTKLAQIRMPYRLYTQDDIAHRVLYVEASRGCPFKCEFCLSALDKTAWPFDLDLFLEEMNQLYLRGARHFKFVDRTFNLKVKNSLKILQFFLDRMDEEMFLHFEVIPDHLPTALKEMIAKFPKGSLQFEIGIQTFNPEVQDRISRRQDDEKAKQNIAWICEESSAYVHTDLIFGLPGESIESFASSFDQLHSLAPHEIQVGILKRLKGSPIVRHTLSHDMVFNPNPPFSIVSNDCISYQDVQHINRFARYWDLVGNSGRFKELLKLILLDKPFANFSVISNGIFTRTGQTHKISLLRLYDLVFNIASEDLCIDQNALKKALKSDHSKSGLKSLPNCLLLGSSVEAPQGAKNNTKNRHNARQARHS